LAVDEAAAVFLPFAVARVSKFRKEVNQMSTALLQHAEVSEEDEELEISGSGYGLNIKKFPVLSTEEEKELFQKLEKNPEDQGVRDEIIKSNFRLVAMWVQRIRHTCQTGDLEFDDLFQEGVKGLIQAVEKFDYKQGNKFSTYASWWIRRTVRRAIDNEGSLIRVPVNFRTKTREFLSVQNELFQELGREPTIEEMAVKMGISPAKASLIQEAIALGKIYSLDTPLGNDDENSLYIDLIDGGQNTQDIAETNLMRETLRQALVEIFGDGRQKKILCLRFGLEDGRSWTLDEVGQEFNITRERVRQIQNKALEKLRENPAIRQQFLKE